LILLEKEVVFENALAAWQIKKKQQEKELS
jgi:hypothetical protein